MHAFLRLPNPGIHPTHLSPLVSKAVPGVSVKWAGLRVGSVTHLPLHGGSGFGFGVGRGRLNRILFQYLQVSIRSNGTNSSKADPT
ncbi:hypothetical protein ACH5RR_022330 [Cinchona calisaya]|uniref:Uncharacterized protein n=1 Tax=Cinchona calisaya TaxID=153742 RepID=A0ABD2Z7I1_9GENT